MNNGKLAQPAAEARIARLSDWLFWISTALAWVLPLTVIAAILRGWFDPAALMARFPGLPSGTVTTPFQGTLVAAVAVVAVYPLVAALLAMRSLFARYRTGEILTDACAGDILRVGRALFLVAAVTVVVPMLQLLILSWNAGPGEWVLSIGLDQGTLGFLVSGGLLVVIGWVMREAARASEENRGFV
jgi:Protein of unknown function (DUF2975)